jgi:Bacterial aa3 type cytochrome c oxidase subunit IV
MPWLCSAYHSFFEQGIIMAGNGDMKAHRETYISVMGMLKWGALGCFLLGMTVVFLIAT